MFQSREEAAAYLAGMIDGEGTVGAYGGPKRNQARRLCITNTETDLIDACSEACILLGVKFAIHQTKPPEKYSHWKIRYDIKITDRKSFNVILSDVPIKSARKKLALENICLSYRNSKNPGPGVLTRMYLEEKRSIVDIAREYATSTATVSIWLSKSGIKPRTLSESVKISWENGGKRRAFQVA